MSAPTEPLDADADAADHFITRRYLYAFAPQWEVQNYIRTQAIDAELARLPEVLAAWARVQPRVELLARTQARSADAIEAEAIGPEHAERLAAIRSDPLFQRTFSAHPISFELVEVDKLVAAQRTVNLAYAERLAARIRALPTLGGLIDLCLSPRVVSECVQHLEVKRDVHVFTSRNTDLRFLGSYRKRLAPEDLEFAAAGGLPVAAVIAFVGYGASSVNAFRVGRRYYLHNGFHRVYAARSAGIARVPVVVQRVHNPMLEFPQQISGMPREYLLYSERPMLISDFFDDELLIDVRIKNRVRTVDLTVTPSQHDVPV